MGLIFQQSDRRLQFNNSKIVFLRRSSFSSNGKRSRWYEDRRAVSSRVETRQAEASSGIGTEQAAVFLRRSLACGIELERDVSYRRKTLTQTRGGTIECSASTATMRKMPPRDKCSTSSTTRLDETRLVSYRSADENTQNQNWDDDSGRLD